MNKYAYDIIQSIDFELREIERQRQSEEDAELEIQLAGIAVVPQHSGVATNPGAGGYRG